MGVSQVLASINEKYWIIKGRSAVKKVIQSCFACRFWSAVPTTQQMGNLPKDRVNGGKVFSSVGTDLMGPIQIRCNRNSIKRYVCIFTCLSSRAVHLEIVQSLEASAFLQAYRRFCNRRNVKPRNMYSDNGRNFVAADKEIKEGLNKWNQTILHDKLRQEETNWHFNPPCASHQGGFYEAFSDSSEN